VEVLLEGIQYARGERLVLDIERLHFAGDSTTALFGPNGSGKTTLLRLVAGLERPTAGTIAPHEVAFSFQRPVFIRGSVRRNLALGLTLRNVGSAQLEARVQEAARELGILELLERPARSLSAGEAQRVNLARALCLRAPVTLLDEPLAGLDRVSRGRLLEELPHLLRTFATTTIIVTHDREEAFRLAERIVVLIDGRVRASGSAGEVYRHPTDRLTAELLGYMVVQHRDQIIAVPPGGLAFGEGERRLDVVVERIVDMGNHRDVVGLAGGCRVSVRIPDGLMPEPERTVSVAIRSSVLLPNQ
jgi:thiamine transport system ATP-binding protein